MPVWSVGCNTRCFNKELPKEGAEVHTSFRFGDEDYVAQLEAYQGVLAQCEEIGKPDIAVHWVDRGTVEFALE